MTPRHRTSLRGLRTFCVAAHHLSFRLAAQELFVTASAVSHQVKSLEAELNVQLFERRNKTLALTTTGASLFQEIQPLMDGIDQTLSQFREYKPKRQLRISAQPFFASEFFVPRLEDFAVLRPDIDIFVDTSDESFEKHPTTVDASIRLFRNVPSNLSSDPLFPLRLVPACSRDFLDRFKQEQDKLTQSFPIILHTGRADAWDKWMASTGIALAKPSRVVSVDSMIAVARAAERGIGAALVPMPLSENWFRYGALVPLFNQEADMDETYYFVTGKSKADSEDVMALRSWVLESFAHL